jgi:hypothetical protein
MEVSGDPAWKNLLRYRAPATIVACFNLLTPDAAAS